MLIFQIYTWKGYFPSVLKNAETEVWILFLQNRDYYLLIFIVFRVPRSLYVRDSLSATWHLKLIYTMTNWHWVKSVHWQKEKNTVISKRRLEHKYIPFFVHMFLQRSKLIWSNSSSTPGSPFPVHRNSAPQVTCFIPDLHSNDVSMEFGQKYRKLH